MTNLTKSEEIERLFHKANNFEKQGKYQRAFKIFSKMVTLGDFSSLNNLAIMYELGQGVEQNIEKAIELYKEGWDKTQQTIFALNLAHLYNKQKNVEQAKIWWQIAIEKGDDEAKLQLAKALLTTENYDKQQIIDLLRDVIFSDNVCEASNDEAWDLCIDMSQNRAWWKYDKTECNLELKNPASAFDEAMYSIRLLHLPKDNLEKLQKLLGKNFYYMYRTSPDTPEIDYLVSIEFNKTNHLQLIEIAKDIEALNPKIGLWASVTTEYDFYGISLTNTELAVIKAFDNINIDLSFIVL